MEIAERLKEVEDGQTLQVFYQTRGGENSFTGEILARKFDDPSDLSSPTAVKLTNGLSISCWKSEESTRGAWTVTGGAKVIKVRRIQP